MQISKYGLQGDLHGSDDEMARAPVQQQEPVLNTLLDQFTHETKRIEAERGLNEHGKRERRQALRREYADKLEQTANRGYRREMKSFENNLENLRGTLAQRLDATPAADGYGMSKIVKAADAPLVEIRAREIRDRLLAMPDSDRLAVAMRAAGEDDTEALRAIVHAPKSFPVLRPHELDLMHESHMRAHYSQQLQEAEKLELLLGTMRYNEHTARAVILGADSHHADPLDEIQNRQAEAH